MEKYFNELQEKIILNEWVLGKSRGRGNGGITLENMIGKERENFEIPDYNGIEIKTKYSKKEDEITLFSSVPDSYLFEIKRIVHDYGYPDNTFPEFKVFNISVYGNRKVKLKNHYFKLIVNRQSEKVILRVYDAGLNIIDENSSWSFELLKEKLERKLTFLALIHAERKYELNQVFFKYTSINFYKLISFEKFIELIESGNIRVTFRIGIYKNKEKLGQIYDHGTSFSISKYKIEELFKKIK